MQNSVCRSPESSSAIFIRIVELLFEHNDNVFREIALESWSTYAIFMEIVELLFERNNDTVFTEMALVFLGPQAH